MLSNELLTKIFSLHLDCSVWMFRGPDAFSRDVIYFHDRTGSFIRNYVCKFIFVYADHSGAIGQFGRFYVRLRTGAVGTRSWKFGGSADSRSMFRNQWNVSERSRISGFYSPFFV